MYTDYPIEDSKPPASDTTTMVREEEYSNGDEGEKNTENDGGLSLKDSDSIIQYTNHSLEATIPESLNCHVFSHNLCHGPTNLGNISKFLEYWTNMIVAKVPLRNVGNLQLQPPCHLAHIKGGENIVALLHHFSSFRCNKNKLPQLLAAVAHNRYEWEKSSQLLFLQAE